MRLKVLEHDLSICKVEEYPAGIHDAPLCFTGKTDEELSLVCPAGYVPAGALVRDDGWRALRIQGELDFSLVGILSKLSALLAQAGIGIFAVSTYNTDYILVKAENLAHALETLQQAGYEIER